MTAVLIGIAHYCVPAIGGTGQGQHMAHNGKRRAHQGLAVNKLQPVDPHDLRYRQANVEGGQLLLMTGLYKSYSSPWGRVTSWIHLPVRMRRAHRGTFSRLSA